jgi:uncharacterized protein with HEPN domain
MNKRDKNLIEDMLRNARLSRQFAENRSRDELDSDLMFAYIAGMRHWLTHGYNNVDNKIVWDVLTANLPELIKQLEAILADVGDEDVEE